MSPRGFLGIYGDKRRYLQSSSYHIRLGPRYTYISVLGPVFPDIISQCPNAWFEASGWGFLSGTNIDTAGLEYQLITSFDCVGKDARSNSPLVEVPLIRSGTMAGRSCKGFVGSLA